MNAVCAETISPVSFGILYTCGGMKRYFPYRLGQMMKIAQPKPINTSVYPVMRRFMYFLVRTRRVDRDSL